LNLPDAQLLLIGVVAWLLLWWLDTAYPRRRR